MTAEERCADFRNHIKIDVSRKLASVVAPASLPHVVEEVVEDVMFYVEHLVLESEQKTRVCAERHVNMASAPPPPEDYECCASGSCEVCRR